MWYDILILFIPQTSFFDPLLASLDVYKQLQLHGLDRESVIFGCVLLLMKSYELWIVLLTISGTTAFNFAVSLDGGGSKCFPLDAATATGLSSSISVSSNDDFQNFLSVVAVKFAYDSDDKQFVYGDNLCEDWILLGSWPTSVTSPTASSTQYHFISTPSPLRLSPGFTEVCIVNTCGNCKCPNVIQFIGQLEIRGFSTSTPLGILPFRLRAEAVDDGGDSQTSGDWKLHAKTSFVEMLNC